MSEVIVADASPLIAFGRINQINLLTELFENVIIPEAVADECLVEKTKPGSVAIQQSINAKAIQIYPNPPAIELAELTDILDIGEAAAIKLASTYRFPLIIDEKLGRAIATKFQVKIIGTAGILLLAKQRKIIKAIKPTILRLKNENYYFADNLIKEILIRAEEI